VSKWLSKHTATVSTISTVFDDGKWYVRMPTEERYEETAGAIRQQDFLSG
jgi:hypothetical protein